LILLSTNIYSLDFEWGLKAGINRNEMYVTRLISDETGFEERYDFLMGAVLKYEINHLFVQIEALYNRKGFIENGFIGNIYTRLHYFDFPILVGLSYYDINLYVGLYYSKYITSYQEIDYHDDIIYEDYSDWGKMDEDLKDYDYGYLLGFGYRWRDISVDFRYSKSRVKYEKGDFDLWYSGRIDGFDQWSLNFTYFFKM
ncbi:outer membrane beta-barrel protein, partial [bacterium]|nr:outer membrane beta-barrel protein [bacterium]